MKPSSNLNILFNSLQCGDLEDAFWKYYHHLDVSKDLDSNDYGEFWLHYFKSMGEQIIRALSVNIIILVCVVIVLVSFDLSNHAIIQFGFNVASWAIASMVVLAPTCCARYFPEYFTKVDLQKLMMKIGILITLYKVWMACITIIVNDQNSLVRQPFPYMALHISLEVLQTVLFLTISFPKPWNMIFTSANIICMMIWLQGVRTQAKPLGTFEWIVTFAQVTVILVPSIACFASYTFEQSAWAIYVAKNKDIIINQDMSRLVNILCTDIRAPLHHIVEGVMTLDRKHLNSSDLVTVDSIVREARYVQTIADDILILSKLCEDRSRFDCCSLIDVNKVTSQALARCGVDVGHVSYVGSKFVMTDALYYRTLLNNSFVLIKQNDSWSVAKEGEPTLTSLKVTVLNPGTPWPSHMPFKHKAFREQHQNDVHDNNNGTTYSLKRDDDDDIEYKDEEGEGGDGYGHVIVDMYFREALFSMDNHSILTSTVTCLARVGRGCYQICANSIHFSVSCRVSSGDDSCVFTSEGEDSSAKGTCDLDMVLPIVSSDINSRDDDGPNAAGKRRAPASLSTATSTTVAATTTPSSSTHALPTIQEGALSLSSSLPVMTGDYMTSLPSPTRLLGDVRVVICSEDASSPLLTCLLHLLEGLAISACHITVVTTITAAVNTTINSNINNNNNNSNSDVLFISNPALLAPIRALGCSKQIALFSGSREYMDDHIAGSFAHVFSIPYQEEDVAALVKWLRKRPVEPTGCHSTTAAAATAMQLDQAVPNNSNLASALGQMLDEDDDNVDYENESISLLHYFRHGSHDQSRVGFFISFLKRHSPCEGVLVLTGRHVLLWLGHHARRLYVRHIINNNKQKRKAADIGQVNAPGECLDLALLTVTSLWGMPAFSPSQENSFVKWRLLFQQSFVFEAKMLGSCLLYMVSLTTRPSGYIMFLLCKDMLGLARVWAIPRISEQFRWSTLKVMTYISLLNMICPITGTIALFWNYERPSDHVAVLPGPVGLSEVSGHNFGSYSGQTLIVSVVVEFISFLPWAVYVPWPLSIAYFTLTTARILAIVWVLFSSVCDSSGFAVVFLMAVLVCISRNIALIFFERKDRHDFMACRKRVFKHAFVQYCVSHCKRDLQAPVSMIIDCKEDFVRLIKQQVHAPHSSPLSERLVKTLSYARFGYCGLEELLFELKNGFNNTHSKPTTLSHSAADYNHSPFFSRHSGRRSNKSKISAAVDQMEAINTNVIEISPAAATMATAAVAGEGVSLNQLTVLRSEVHSLARLMLSLQLLQAHMDLQISCDVTIHPSVTLILIDRQQFRRAVWRALAQAIRHILAAVRASPRERHYEHNIHVVITADPLDLSLDYSVVRALQVQMLDTGSSSCNDWGNCCGGGSGGVTVTTSDLNICPVQHHSSSSSSSSSSSLLALYTHNSHYRLSRAAPSCNQRHSTCQMFEIPYKLHMQTFDAALAASGVPVTVNVAPLQWISRCNGWLQVMSYLTDLKHHLAQRTLISHNKHRRFITVQLEPMSLAWHNFVEAEGWKHICVHHLEDINDIDDLDETVDCIAVCESCQQHDNGLAVDDVTKLRLFGYKMVIAGVFEHVDHMCDADKQRFDVIIIRNVAHASLGDIINSAIDHCVQQLLE